MIWLVSLFCLVVVDNVGLVVLMISISGRYSLVVSVILCWVLCNVVGLIVFFLLFIVFCWLRIIVGWLLKWVSVSSVVVVLF